MSIIERKRWRQENVLEIDFYFYFFLRGFWQPVLLSVQTSMSALLTVPATISVSTLPAASSATVTKATSSTVWHTVEVSQHPSTQHPRASLFNWQLLDRVCPGTLSYIVKFPKVLKVYVVFKQVTFLGWRLQNNLSLKQWNNYWKKVETEADIELWHQSNDASATLLFGLKYHSVFLEEMSMNCSNIDLLIVALCEISQQLLAHTVGIPPRML